MSMNTIKNDDIWLDVETVAKLKGITERGVRLSLSKKYDYKEEIVKGKKIYKIRLKSLEKEYQLKYENEYSNIYKTICNEIVEIDNSGLKRDKLISEVQKKNALAKYDLVKSWLDFRKDFKNKCLTELSNNPNTQFLELYNTGIALTLSSVVYEGLPDMLLYKLTNSALSVIPAPIFFDNLPPALWLPPEPRPPITTSLSF